MAKGKGTTRRRTAGSGPRKVVSPKQQASGHRQEREDHRLALVHDYVQVIADLIDQEGEARIVDIAARFGVSHVTALKNVERLQREGLAETKPRRSVFLTDTGWELVQRLRHRYDIVVRFLMSLGISEASARADAEGIEHHVGEETLAAFERRIQS
jgi:DtxR family manganese transport transcriptional regulator